MNRTPAPRVSGFAARFDGSQISAWRSWPSTVSYVTRESGWRDTGSGQSWRTSEKLAPFALATDQTLIVMKTVAPKVRREAARSTPAPRLPPSASAMLFRSAANAAVSASHGRYEMTSWPRRPTSGRVGAKPPSTIAAAGRRTTSESAVRSARIST